MKALRHEPYPFFALMFLLICFIASNAYAQECGYKGDGKYHCGTNCSYKGDGNYHCGTNCSYKGDGNYHCEGEDSIDSASPKTPGKQTPDSSCGYKGDGKYHCIGDG